MTRENHLLVIGYGNTLRSDDGVGRKVAEAVAGLGLPGVQAIGCPQLTPEYAEPVSQAELVIFVDASVDLPKEVRLRPLAPNESSQLLGHSADPRTVLALARDVFGHVPRAWWLTIPAEEFRFGEELSPLAQAGFEAALARIRALVSETASEVNPS
jgi:hydrogenase maturation protease